MFTRGIACSGGGEGSECDNKAYIPVLIIDSKSSICLDLCVIHSKFSAFCKGLFIMLSWVVFSVLSWDS